MITEHTNRSHPVGTENVHVLSELSIIVQQGIGVRDNCSIFLVFGMLDNSGRRANEVVFNW